MVREAIRETAAAGIPVLTLVSDIAHAPRVGYVGIDNRNAGRLAGHLLGRFVPGSAGEVALFAGSLSYRGHEEREMGFRHVLADEFPNLRIVELREVRDDLERSYREARRCWRHDPSLRGIYNIGAGNRGIARALEEAGRAREVVFIGHELTEHTRRFLLSGTMDAVIDQNPRVEAREAIDRLLRAARGEPSPIRSPSASTPSSARTCRSCDRLRRARCAHARLCTPASAKMPENGSGGWRLVTTSRASCSSNVRTEARRPNLLSSTISTPLRLCGKTARRRSDSSSA